jgi:hypothetical protein
MTVRNTTSPNKPTSEDIDMPDCQTTSASGPPNSQTTSALETASSFNSASAPSSRQTTPSTPEFPDLDFDSIKPSSPTNSDTESTTPTTASALPQQSTRSIDSRIWFRNFIKAQSQKAEKDKTPLWTPEMRAELDRTWVVSPAMAMVKKDVAQVAASRVPQWGLRSPAERRGV